MVLVVIVIAAMMMLALGRVIWRAAFFYRRLPVTAEWIADLAELGCPPMLQPPDGCEKRLPAALRRERCQLFKDYLQRLEEDFGRATLALKVVMLQSRRDRPDLAAALLQQQLAFGCGLVSARARLLLYGWGIGSVDVSRPVRVFEAVAGQLRAALPAGVAA